MLFSKFDQVFEDPPTMDHENMSILILDLNRGDNQARRSASFDQKFTIDSMTYSPLFFTQFND